MLFVIYRCDWCCSFLQFVFAQEGCERTRVDINDLLNINSPTSLIAPTRSKMIPTRVFRMVFTNSMVDHLVTKTNDNLASIRRGSDYKHGHASLHCSGA